MFGDQESDSVGAERPASAGREEWPFGLIFSFLQPDSQDRDGLAGERGGPLFAAFACAAEILLPADLNGVVVIATVPRAMTTSAVSGPLARVGMSPASFWNNSRRQARPNDDLRPPRSPQAAVKSVSY